MGRGKEEEEEEEEEETIREERREGGRPEINRKEMTKTIRFECLFLILRSFF